jgi:hypothetical protein
MKYAVNINTVPSSLHLLNFVYGEKWCEDSSFSVILKGREGVASCNQPHHQHGRGETSLRRSDRRQNLKHLPIKYNSDVFLLNKLPHTRWSLIKISNDFCVRDQN